ncbi:MAG TPA: MBL fold metallo-hydrolase [Candidatus Cybelea sp.]|nr:MBL fold metallo-hydrolase [Candidatus Cybelea sp.]
MGRGHGGVPGLGGQAAEGSRGSEQPAGSIRTGRDAVAFWTNRCRSRRSTVLATFCFLFCLATPLSAPSQDRANWPAWCRNLPRPEYKKLERIPSPDAWFEVYRVAPQVFAIYEPRQFEEAISFLILGRQRAALFDTGLGIGDIRKVVHSLTLLPIVVINSHTHDDHVGDNWEFSDIYAMDTRFTKINARGSSLDAQAELAPGNLCGALPAGFDRMTYRTRPFHITHWAHDGDTIDLGGRTLQVIATPGHTPDAISLLDRPNGLLFTGDSYYAGPIWLFRPETDLDAYVRSVERMAKLTPQLTLLLPSHNVPVGDPAELPRLLTAIREVRAGRVRPRDAGGGKVAYQIEEFTFLMSAVRR